MKVIFEPKDMGNVRDLISDYVGVKLNDGQLHEFVDELSKHTVSDILACDGHCGDTMTREMIMDDFAKFLINRKWPINGDGKEYSERFFIDLGKAMKNKGYEPKETS